MRLQFSNSKIRPTFSALMTLMTLPLHAAQALRPPLTKPITASTLPSTASPSPRTSGQTRCELDAARNIP